MWDTLSEARQEGRVVEINRENFDCRMRGYIGAVSADLVVVLVVDSHCNFDGAVVVQLEDVTLVRWEDSVLRARTGVLQETPSSPASVKHLDLASWESVVRSVSAHESVISFHREHVASETCVIGINVRVDGDHIVGDEVAIDGALDGQFALRTSDLTKIDFGGGYELALWRMIQSAKRVDSS